ncbi:hypothetical protein EJ08DRAFT_342798 [Tothia fuscella]|uniref:Uncharacterized protein n=1 Tax=Tothia fuscella TaxID=1048955 RepID=A0A9P4P2F0_9PEZI|nr:hypothetical protein EJ08DRAFT_342798 [Tothia fuscella]
MVSCLVTRHKSFLKTLPSYVNTVSDEHQHSAVVDQFASAFNTRTRYSQHPCIIIPFSLSLFFFFTVNFAPPRKLTTLSYTNTIIFFPTSASTQITTIFSTSSTSDITLSGNSQRHGHELTRSQSAPPPSVTPISPLRPGAESMEPEVNSPVAVPRKLSMASSVSDPPINSSATFTVVADSSGNVSVMREEQTATTELITPGLSSSIASKSSDSEYENGIECSNQPASGRGEDQKVRQKLEPKMKYPAVHDPDSDMARMMINDQVSKNLLQQWIDWYTIGYYTRRKGRMSTFREKRTPPGKIFGCRVVGVDENVPIIARNSSRVPHVLYSLNHDPELENLDDKDRNMKAPKIHEVTIREQATASISAYQYAWNQIYALLESEHQKYPSFLKGIAHQKYHVWKSLADYTMSGDSITIEEMQNAFDSLQNTSAILSSEQDLRGDQLPTKGGPADRRGKKLRIAGKQHLKEPTRSVDLVFAEAVLPTASIAPLYFHDETPLSHAHGGTYLDHATLSPRAVVHSQPNSHIYGEADMPMPEGNLGHLVSLHAELRWKAWAGSKRKSTTDESGLTPIKRVGYMGKKLGKIVILKLGSALLSEVSIASGKHGKRKAEGDETEEPQASAKRLKSNRHKSAPFSPMKNPDTVPTGRNIHASQESGSVALTSPTTTYISGPAPLNQNAANQGVNKRTPWPELNTAYLNMIGRSYIIDDGSKNGRFRGRKKEGVNDLMAQYHARFKSHEEQARTYAAIQNCFDRMWARGALIGDIPAWCSEYFTDDSGQLSWIWPG